MVRLLIMLLIAARLFAASGAATAKPADGATSASFTFSKRVEETRLRFTVRDNLGNPVRGLRAEDITLMQDGASVSAFTSFRETSNSPVQFTLLLDDSESMRFVIGSEQRVARLVFRDMDQGEGNSAALVRFATTSVTSGPAPTDVPKLKAVGLTAIYDTLCDIADESRVGVSRANESGKRDRERILVVLSDGEDNLSRHTLADAIRALQRADFVVYPVTIHSRRWQYRWQYVGDAVLEQLAAATGGQVFRLRNYQQLEKVIADIKAGHRAQYEVGFRLREGEESGFHPVEIRTPNRTWEVRAKTGYYIP